MKFDAGLTKMFDEDYLEPRTDERVTTRPYVGLAGRIAFRNKIVLIQNYH